jgi:hypothetical protein
MDTQRALSTTGTSNRVKILGMAACALIALGLSAPSAHANCGMLSGKAGGLQFPTLGGITAHLPGEDEETAAKADTSIVGMWHAVYTADGGIFGVSLKQWHSDGLENEIIDHSPVVGNTCMGIWKQTGSRTVYLHHLGWLFDDTGAPVGSFIINEVDTVASNGLSYSGTFTFKTYGTDGTYTGTEIKGSIKATRITAD